MPQNMRMFFPCTLYSGENKAIREIDVNSSKYRELQVQCRNRLFHMKGPVPMKAKPGYMCDGCKQRQIAAAAAAAEAERQRLLALNLQLRHESMARVANWTGEC